MPRNRKLISCALGALLCACSARTDADDPAPRRPFPQHLVYADGTIKPRGRTQAELDADAAAFYDRWKSDYLVEAKGVPGGFRVSFGKEDPARTVSEGQGYGMVIAALMAGYDPDAKEIFDGLWAFVRSHPSNIDGRLMAWEVPEPAGGTDSAFDGDADIAYGLLLADAQWGSEGKVDYRAEALKLISAIGESTIGPESRLPLLGDWVEVDGAAYNQYTPRSSDFMPAHFRAYGRASGDGLWNDVIAATQEAVDSLQLNYAPKTGLLPDFIRPVSASDHRPRPAAANFLEGPNDGNYFYNAGRDPWRLGTDALLSGDPASLAQTRRIADWIHEAMAGDPGNIRAGYKLNGEPLEGSDYFTAFFASPLGVALMTRPAFQADLDALYDAVSRIHEDYYQDSVTLLCLLVMTGNYWAPGTLQ